MEQSIYKQFWRYTLPTIVAMLVNGLYQIVDGIFIGHYIGADGLAAINLAWPIVGSVLGLGMMIGVGTGAIASIWQGEERIEDAKTIIASSMVFIVFLAPIISFSLMEFSPFLLRSQGAEGVVFDMALEYVQVLYYASPIVLTSFAIPFLLRNDNRPNLATILMVVGALTNIALDYVFIVLLDWELLGAAIATSIAQSVVAVIGLSYFFSPFATLRIRLKHFSLDWEAMLRISGMGASSFFMYAYGCTMVALHNWMFSVHSNLLVVGAYAIVGYIVTIYYFVAEGIANGMQPLVSFNYGAQRHNNVYRLLKIAMATAVIGGIVFSVLVNLFPQGIVSIFNGTDPALQQEAIVGIRLHLFAVFLDGFIVVASAYYQALGESKKAVMITVGNIVIQLPFLFVLPGYFGVDGVWMAFPLSNIALSGLIFFVLLRDVKLSPSKTALRLRQETSSAV